MAAKPTMQDVAQRAGVSRSLVSLVFQNAENVSATRRQAVLDAAEELGYRPNMLARNLAQGRSMTIGVVIDDLQNPFFGRIIDSLEHRLRPHGYQVIVANGARDAERSNHAAETFIDLQVDGLVLAPRGPIEPIIEFGRRTPTVLVARSADTDALDTVQVDERVGSQLVVDHLQRLGHRSIVHIDGGGGASAGDRRNGYRRAMEEAGLGAEIDIIAGEFTHEAGTKAALEVAQRAERPTAIFAGNDLIAAGVWIQLERSGLGVPDDISLVGFDDSSLPGFVAVGLTTVHQPAAELGDRAGAFLLERLDGSRSEARHEDIAPNLIERTSTQAVTA